jgi:hypothetical protein
LLTKREFEALQREWMRERGIKPPLTKAERDQLEYNKNWLLQMQLKAHNKVLERKRLRKESKLALVEKKEANG